MTLLAKYTIALTAGLMVILTTMESALAQERTYTPAEIQAAFKAVLDHNDLSDREALAKHLGIEMRLDKKSPNTNPNEVFEGSFQQNPSFLYASGLRYSIRTDQAKSITFLGLDFGFRVCPDLYQWIKDWKLKPRMSMPMLHAMGSYTQLESKEFDIGFVVTQYSAGGCSGRLTQKFNRALSIKSASNPVRVPSEGYVRKLVDLLTSGDLRDEKNVARTLQVQLSKGNERAEKQKIFSVLFTVRGNGFKPAGFNYYIKDSSWQRMPSHYHTQRKLSARSVYLRVPVDTQVLCMGTNELTDELKKRSINYSIVAINSNSTAVSVAGSNQITVNTWSQDGCVIDVNFQQITDFENNLQSPVIFAVPPNTSDKNGLRLSAADLKIIDLLLWHAKEVKLQQVVVTAIYSESDSISKSDALNLANALKQKLIEHGVEESFIKMEVRGFTSTTSTPAMPSVTVDPIAAD